MASILLPYEQANVTQGDIAKLTNTFETARNSGLAATVSAPTVLVDASTLATPNAGTGTPVPTTSAGITGANGAYEFDWTVPWLQIPGDYLVTWTAVVGSVTETYQYVVQVLPAYTGAPSPGWYCMIEQYRAVTGDQATPDSVIVPQLTAASEDIDNALTGAVYQTNQQGLPVKGFVIDAFTRATARQIQWLIADNDPAGVKRMYRSTSVAGVSFTRAPNLTTGAFPLLAPRAAQILHQAGVLPSAVLINW